MRISEEEYLEHYGVKGMKWGVINEDKDKKSNAKGTTRSDAAHLEKVRKLERSEAAANYHDANFNEKADKRFQAYDERSYPEYYAAKEYFSKNPGKNTYVYESSFKEPTIMYKPTKGPMGTYTEFDIFYAITHGEIRSVPPDVVKAAVERFPRVKKAYAGASYVYNRLGRNVRVNAKEVIESKNRR